MEPPRAVRNNAVARAINLIGEKWTLWILREAFYGVERFETFQERLGIPRDTLSRRLATMVEHGLFERKPYKELSNRTRYAYHLTPMSRALFPALVALLQWGDHYLADEKDTALTLKHRGCGGVAEALVLCRQGHIVAGPEDITVSATET